jgi:SAM-dependent methyltransferase
MGFDNSWEDNIYSKGLQLNKYPYGDVVSMFFRALSLIDKSKDRKDIRVLELGCGSGNNLWFFAELGFDVYGIDGSVSACNEAQKILESRNCKAKVINSDFSTLDFEDGYFDIIIDREAISSNSFSDINGISKEINRVLNKNGIVVSMMYSNDNPNLIKVKDGKYIADEVDYNSFTNFDQGTFVGQGVKFFATQDDISKIFDFCDIKFLNKSNNSSVINKMDGIFEYTEWVTIAQKG